MGRWRIGLVAVGIGGSLVVPVARADGQARVDPHSFARPDQVRVRHLELSLTVDFDHHELAGSATWTVERPPGTPAGAALVLDTSDLAIEDVGVLTDQGLRPAPYTLGDGDAIRGRPLRIGLDPGTESVRIRYRTSPGARALQWVRPEGTAGKGSPFLYSQSQAIQARSWIPCQDSPGVRVTYEARVQVPPGRPSAVMSGEEITRRPGRDGHDPGQPRVFAFRMDRPIPPYLIALAVGELDHRALGDRSGVWAEPALIGRAEAEFCDTQRMLAAAEKRFGPYRWGAYNILVLPPSFPFGGMENARMTFVTPAVLAGDRSLIALIAHELAHSWSGNLVTCASWRDFWLNEGFTTYLERRITEDLYGPERADMEWVLGMQTLRRELAALAPRNQILANDLTGRDPDEGLNGVPYEKGALFLRSLEESVGRDRFDAYLRGYFDRFAFCSLTTEEFADDWRQCGPAPSITKPVDLDAWLYRPGLPADAPVIHSARLDAVAGSARRWLDRAIPAADLPAAGWSTLEWLAFLRSLPPDLPAARLGELDAAFHLTAGANAEVTAAWLERAVRAGYTEADARLESYLTTIGRRRYIEPLYEALARTPAGKARARAIYAKARPGYHPLAVGSLDALLGGAP